MTTRKEFTTKTRIAALIRANWRCQKCNADFKDTKLKLKPEYDHILPCCDGGDNSLDNCQVLCDDCHKVKTKKDVVSHRKSKRIYKKENAVKVEKPKSKIKRKWGKQKFKRDFKPNVKQAREL